MPKSPTSVQAVPSYDSVSAFAAVPGLTPPAKYSAFEVSVTAAPAYPLPVFNVAFCVHDVPSNSSEELEGAPGPPTCPPIAKAAVCVPPPETPYRAVFKSFDSVHEVPL